jgi:hypothetical protein
MEAHKNILVTGDYVIDHHLLQGNKSDSSDSESKGTTSIATYGGARLTFELTEKIVTKLMNELPDREPTVTTGWPYAGMPPLTAPGGSRHESWLRWIVTRQQEKGETKTSCRLIEKLGFGGSGGPDDEEWFRIDRSVLKMKFHTVVIDEADLGFRDRRDAWPEFKEAVTIILKASYPLCEGLLWDELMNYRQKLITIVKLKHLKHYEIKVSNDISWEQTALDIVYGISSHSTLRNLLRSGELIITIGSAGAIHVRTNDDPALNEYTLVFDPGFMENEWEEKNSRDILNTTGLGSSFVAGFAASLSIKNKSVTDSIRAGLNAMNAAMLKGIYLLGDDYTFKTEDLSDALDKTFRNRYYSSAFVPSPAWQSGFKYLHNQEWSILENNYDNKRQGYKQKPDLFPLAFSLAESGIKELRYAPRLTLGRVTVFDRSEIENIRNIRKQVDFYDRFDDGKKPLNIAVFGPPGAGKSFIVKALANNMFDGKKTKPSFLTFNLSQFREEAELSGAFHAVRDEVLRGKLPVVFWDEFDSSDYRWLKCMIAPMQDGEFQEGKGVHPIGKSIFVFAGGVTYTMKHFTGKMEEPGYAVKKGPDFQSRINCSLNVFGPNRKPYPDNETGSWLKEGDQNDICFSIRRALFIRSILSSDDKRLDIDRELLRALIEVRTFRNGSRGLERLLRNLAVHSGIKIERSDLPSKEIIQMNLDYDDFMERLSDESTFRDLAFEKIATSIHNSWMEKGVAESVFHKRYEDLSYDQRVDNISAARRIKEVIEATGKFTLISVAELRSRMLPDARKEFAEYINDTVALDKLAELEHNGWMNERQTANWNYGARSDYHKLHNCIVPFSELDTGINAPDDQKEKNKDRDTIRKYASMLEGSGYTITFLKK